jgi:prepilin-type processing-associated H-X9-DG protein
MSETTPPRPCGLAVASLLLGLASLLGGCVTGVPALVLGLRGLRAVNASDGRLRGRRLAFAGMALGACGTAVTVVGFTLAVMFHLREKSHRDTCADNLRQIGVALNAYAADHRDRFPPGTVPNPALPPEQRLSWLAGILPFLSEKAPGGLKGPELAGKIDYRQAWDAPANAGAGAAGVRLFRCPSDPSYAPQSRPGLTNYVGLAGVGPDAAALDKKDPRAGFFGYDRTITREDVTAGLSYTMAVAETARDLGRWAAGGPATVRGLDPDEELYAGPGRPFGGLHRGALNVLWADGSVRFVDASVSPHLFRAQATLAGRAEEVPETK